MFWIGMLIGIGVAAPVGIVALALCIAARRGDSGC